jgi:hypothetical protein
MIFSKAIHREHGQTSDFARKMGELNVPPMWLRTNQQVHKRIEASEGYFSNFYERHFIWSQWYCRNKWIGPISALYRSLFCHLYHTTDQDSGLGPSSYTQHFCIAWQNLLQQTFCTNIALSKAYNKTFWICQCISTSFHLFPQGQRWNNACLEFTLLADILSGAPQYY